MTNTPDKKHYRLAIRRPVAMVMLFVTLIVFGWKSYQQLPINLMPNISYPTLTVRTEYAGAAPEDVEKLVTRPLEETLSIVSGLVEVSSSSSAGLSEISLEFLWGTDMNLSLQEVRDRLDLFDPPKEVTEKPVILRYDPSLDPVLRVAVTGLSFEEEADPVRRADLIKKQLTAVREAAERHLKSDLEAEPGIAQVLVKGGREEEIQINVDSAQLKNLGLSLEDIVTSLAQQNINLSGGRLREGKTEYLVRTLNEYADIEEIRNTILSSPKGGAGAVASLGTASSFGGLDAAAGAGFSTDGGKPIRLSDVARVFRGEKERETVVRVNGKEAVALDLFKEGDANTVQVCNHLKKVLGLAGPSSFSEWVADKLTSMQSGSSGPNSVEQSGTAEQLAKTVRSRLPKNTEFTLISDQSRFIKGAIREAQDSAILGGVLALIIIFLFLKDIPPTFIIGLAIPISLVATFVPMHMWGISLNVMSLGGLALAVGHLVDDSIIVLESIYRCKEEGDTGLDAVERGVREILAADVSTTVTNCVVFLPMAFVGGMAGQIFGHFAFTMTFSVLCSLLVALYLDPMLMSLTPERIGARGNVVWMIRAYNGARDAGRSRLSALGGIIPAGVRDAWAWMVEATSTILGPTWRTFRGAGFAGWSFSRINAVFARLVALPFVLILFVLQVALKVVSAVFLLVLLSVGLVLLVAWVLGSRVLHVVLWVPLQAFEVGYVTVRYFYSRLLRLSLTFGPVVLLIAAGLAGYSVWLSQQLGRELIPPLRQGEFTVRYEARPGTRLEETEQIAQKIEKVILANVDVESVGVEIGVEKSSKQTERGENIAKFNVSIKDPEVNAQRQDEIIEVLRRDIRLITGDDLTFVLPTLFSFKTAVELQIRGDELEELRRVGTRVIDAIKDIPGLKDPDLSVKKGYPEVIIELDRELLATRGITPLQVAQRLRTEIQGDIATRFSQGGEKIDMRVRSDQEGLQSVADLGRISVTEGDPPTPLSAVVRGGKIRIEDGPSEIRRIDQRQVVVVSGNVEGFDLGTVTQEIERRLHYVEKPEDYAFMFGGQNRELRTSFDNLQLALLLSIFLVYAVMAIQFESLVQPALIMLTVPLGFIGVITVLYFLDMPLSVAVFMGGILLVGVIVSNSILLVDYANLLRERGLKRRDAIYQSGLVRFRPVLMTALTTIVGAIPMAMSSGEGAELRRPLAVTVIAGLSVGTLLTLVVIPVVYDLFSKRDRPGASS